MFAREDGLAKETEVGHFGFVDDLVATKFKNRVLNLFGVEFVHFSVYFDTHAIQVLNLSLISQYFHEIVDLHSLGLGREDGLLTDFLPPKIIKVVGNAGESAQFREDVGRSGAGASFLFSLRVILNPQKGLLDICDVNIVLRTVILLEVRDFFTDDHIHHADKFNIKYLVECGFSICGQNY